jgi:hypothetical protein
MSQGYAGTDLINFQYFFGVVEDRQDPLKMGRVRVRAFGVHTEDRSKIPTESLPWATPIMPYTSASISGIGESPTGPVEGTWVFGFFVDGKQLQQPMIMGTLAGAPEAYNDLGFNDPNKVYPKIEIPGESDVNRLARGDAIRASTIEAPSVRAGENILAHKKKHRVLKMVHHQGITLKHIIVEEHGMNLIQDMVGKKKVRNQIELIKNLCLVKNQSIH